MRRLNLICRRGSQCLREVVVRSGLGDLRICWIGGVEVRGGGLVFPSAEEPAHAFYAGEEDDGDEEGFEGVGLLALEEAALEVVHDDSGEGGGALLGGTHELRLN